MAFQDRILNFDREQLGAKPGALTFSREEVEGLAVILFRAVRLAAFQQEQLHRLAKLVPVPDQADAELIVASANERGEAIAADFAAWLGPELAEVLLHLAAAEKTQGTGT